MIPLVAELRAGFREPLLAGMGRWLVAETPLQKADLVVALGGGQERQEEAARLLKQGLAQWVLFVGSDMRPRDYRCLEVPTERAVPPPAPAHTTYEEAVTTRTVVQERGFRSVLIVTSPYHERRAWWVFERVFRGTGVVLLVASAPHTAFPLDAWWKSPVGRKAVLMEYVGLVYYWLTV